MRGPGKGAAARFRKDNVAGPAGREALRSSDSVSSTRQGQPDSRSTAACGVRALLEQAENRRSAARHGRGQRAGPAQAAFIWSISGWWRAMGASRSLIICAAREGQGPGTCCGSRAIALRSTSRSLSYQR